jgi:hypothetical protein
MVQARVLPGTSETRQANIQMEPTRMTVCDNQVGGARGSFATLTGEGFIRPGRTTIEDPEGRTRIDRPAEVNVWERF